MRPNSIRPDINVTPLVDVVLVLLIIFMVITPQMEAGAAVDLPAIQNADPKTEAKLEPITVSLSATGGIYLEKDKLERSVVVERLRKIHSDKPERRILLKGDRAVAYEEVRALFKECQEIGFPGIALQVGDRKPDAANDKGGSWPSK